MKIRQGWFVRIFITMCTLVIALGVCVTSAFAAKQGRYEVTVTCDVEATDTSQSPAKKVKGSASSSTYSDTLPMEVALAKDTGATAEQLVQQVVREQLKVPSKTEVLVSETNETYAKGTSPKNSPLKLTTSDKPDSVAYAKNPVYYVAQLGKDGPVVNVKANFSVSARDTQPEEEKTQEDEVAVQEEYSLTVAVSPDEGGQISSDPQAGNVAEGTSVTINATANEQDGFVFVGWTVTPESLVTTGEGTSLSFTMPGNSVSVTANFAVPHAVTVAANPQEGGSPSADPTSAVEGQTVSLSPSENTGYRFTSWSVTPNTVTIGEDNTFTMPNEAVSVTANYENVYGITVTNDGNGSAGADKESAAEDEEVTLTKEAHADYEFDYWEVIAPERLQITDDIFTMPGQAVEIKAHFKKKPALTYAIKVTNDGHGSGKASKDSATEGEAITLTATPNSGYVFSKWEVVKPSGLQITNNSFTMPSSDVEVKAIFAAEPAPTSYSIKVTNDGHGSGKASKSSAIEGETITLSATAKSGYTFSKWQVVSPSGLKITNNKFTMPAANVEVKAVFKAKPTPKTQTYTVSFNKNANDATGKMSNQEIKCGVSTKLNANGYQRSGYTFAGWNTAANGSGTSYANGQEVKDLAAADKTITLHAQWRRITYTISYSANGGSGTMTPQTANAGEVATLKANAFTHTGYTFAGWNTKPDGSGTYIADRASVKVNGNMTLYAQWRKNSSNSGSNTNGSNVYRTTNGTLSRTADPTSFAGAAIAAFGGVSLVFFGRRRR